MVKIKDLLKSTMAMEAVEESIGAFGTIKINVDVDCQAKKLSLDDLKQIYKTFILKTISSKEPYQWSGNLPSSYQSILSILLSVTDGTIISKRDSISQAFIEAFNIQKFDDKILFEHIENIAENHQEFLSLKIYSQQCLNVLEGICLHENINKINQIMKNLKILLENNVIEESTVVESVKKSTKKHFHVEKAKKELEMDTKCQSNENLDIQICRAVINWAIVDLHKSVQNVQNLFEENLCGKIVFDYENIRKEVYVELCHDLIQESLPANIRVPIRMEYCEDDPRIKDLLTTLDIFRSTKILWKNANPFTPIQQCQWLFDLFKDYPEIWFQHLTINKAATTLENTLKKLKEDVKDVKAAKEQSCNEESSKILG